MKMIMKMKMKIKLQMKTQMKKMKKKIKHFQSVARCESYNFSTHSFLVLLVWLGPLLGFLQPQD